MKQPAVYILASQRNGTLYTGVTGDLVQRIWQHKNDIVAGFTKKYRVHTLVYYEWHDDIENAILREKRLKKWNRAWKLRSSKRGIPTGTICIAPSFNHQCHSVISSQAAIQISFRHSRAEGNQPTPVIPAQRGISPLLSFPRRGESAHSCHSRAEGNQPTPVIPAQRGISPLLSFPRRRESS